MATVPVPVPARTPPPPRPWFTATCCGEYVEGDTDLGRLLRVLTADIMDPGADNDVIITAGGRCVAVVRGDDLAVVRVR